MISTRVRLGRNVLVQWKRDKTCPDCGKLAKLGSTAVMRDVCGKMWRKYNDLDDRHCALWSNAEVASVSSTDADMPKQAIQWENMPAIVGRS